MRNQLTSITVLSLLILISWNHLNRSLKEGSLDLEKTNTLIANVNLDIHEVYELPDKVYEEIVLALDNKEINKFQPFTSLEMDFFKPNIIGVTSSESNKEAILKEINALDSIPKNVVLKWSRTKQLNKPTQESYFYLYALKPIDPKFDIRVQEIEEAKLQKSYNDSHQIIIKLNNQGSKKWAALTKKAADNGNRCLAISVDGQVFSCPMVNSSITGGFLSITGFESNENANSFIQKIKSNR